MTRKEFEEIKRQYCKTDYDPYLPPISLNEIRKLIHALENGGIEDEPDENDEPELIPCPFCPAGTSALDFVYVERTGHGHYMCDKTEGGCGASAGYTAYNISVGYK